MSFVLTLGGHSEHAGGQCCNSAGSHGTHGVTATSWGAFLGLEVQWTMPQALWFHLPVPAPQGMRLAAQKSILVSRVRQFSGLLQSDLGKNTLFYYT